MLSAVGIAPVSDAELTFTKYAVSYVNVGRYRL
jgi:hypothetical protein